MELVFNDLRLLSSTTRALQNLYIAREQGSRQQHLEIGLAASASAPHYERGWGSLISPLRGQRLLRGQARQGAHRVSCRSPGPIPWQNPGGSERHSPRPGHLHASYHLWWLNNCTWLDMPHSYHSLLYKKRKTKNTDSQCGQGCRKVYILYFWGRVSLTRFMHISDL